MRVTTGVRVETHRPRQIEFPHETDLGELVQRFVHRRQRNARHPVGDSGRDILGERVTRVANERVDDGATLRGEAQTGLAYRACRVFRSKQD